MNLSSFFHSTAARLAATFAGFNLIGILALLASSYWLISAELDERLKQRVANTATAYVTLDRGRGFTAVLESVQAHVTAADEVDSVFLLLDRNNKSVAGNINPIAPFDGLRVIDNIDIHFSNGEVSDNEQIVARFVDLSEGHLLVGHSTKDIAEIESIILGASVWGVSGGMLFAVAVAIWIGWRAQLRINSIDDTLSAVADGLIDRRIVLAGSGDDLDQVSERMNATLDRLASLMDSMRQISADIAHDLKTPIGRLRQKLDTALRTTRGETELRNEIGIARRELDDVVATFDALLRIAQIEAGARKSRFVPVDLAIVLRDIEEIYMSVAEDAGMKMCVALNSQEPVLIDGDTELLTQMFANLIENAIRHCPPGSLITITLGRTNKDAVITIADTGPGIPEPERDKVFRRFYRQEKGRSTPGSGLGLSLVAAIADLHGAKIALMDREPGLIVELTFDRKSGFVKV